MDECKPLLDGDQVSARGLATVKVALKDREAGAYTRPLFSST